MTAEHDEPEDGGAAERARPAVVATDSSGFQVGDNNVQYSRVAIDAREEARRWGRQDEVPAAPGSGQGHGRLY